MRTYHYNELFSKEVFELFKNYSESYAKEIGGLEVDENHLSIDVDQILKIMNIPIEETLLDYRLDEFDPQNPKVLVNITDSAERKGYTKAHGLGCFFIKDTDAYDHEERRAYDLANEILMPKKLVAIVIDLYQMRKNLTDEELESENPMFFTVMLSKYMNVSMTAMRYRLIDLGVLVNE